MPDFALQLFCLSLLLATASAGARAGMPETVLPETLSGGAAGSDMVKGWLKPQTDAAWARWKAGFEERMKSGGWDERAAMLRTSLLEAIGGLPAERTPLRARTTGTLRSEGFRVEKVIFESEPRFHVTASLYLPESAGEGAPLPAVLVPCGHARPAKAHDEYQSAGALLALNGFVALVYDPVDQGERLQRLDEDGQPISWGTFSHVQEGLAGTLLGWNLIRSQVWDGMRAVDYLASRPEVDATRLGVTGNSGGGTQMSTLFVLDDRLSVAAPSCYIHQLHHQVWDKVGDSEQMFFGQLAVGFEHAEFFLSRAPAPVLILAATHDFFAIDKTWETFRFIKRRYTDLGFSERAAIFENNAGHNYNRQQREAMVEWMLRWLKGEDRDVREPELDLFTEEELRVTPTGQVLQLEGARSIWDLYRAEAERLAASRGSPDGVELEARIRRVTGIEERTENLRAKPAFAIERDNYTAAAFVLEWGESPLAIPMLVLRETGSAAENRPPMLIATDRPVVEFAKDPFLARSWGDAGAPVIFFNPTGMGESRQTSQEERGEIVGLDVSDAFALYQLGSSQLAMHTEDVMRVMRFVRERGLASGDRVAMGGQGPAALPVLHAAVLERDGLDHVLLRQPLHSWSNFIELERSYQLLQSVVYGVLRQYDLPDLVGALGSLVTVESPVDAIGLEIRTAGDAPSAAFSRPHLPGLHGLYFGNIRFENPAGTETLERLEATWENAVHRRGNDWAGEWSGFLIGPADGVVEFAGASDQQIELEVEGDLILERTAFPGSARGRMKMENGRLYRATVRYIQPRGEQGSFALAWSWGDRPMEVIGRESLRHSAEQEYRARERMLK